VADSMGAVAQLYDHFELPLSSEAEQAMSDHVRQNPRGQHGSHDYDLSSYGLTAEQVRERMQWYIDRFELDA